MGLMTITQSLLKESGLSDTDISNDTGLDKVWLHRFRKESRGDDLIKRVESLHDYLKKEVAKKRKRERARKAK